MRIDSWVQDVGFAFRTLRRRWVYGVVAVVTLGLGIGSATAMFSVVDGVLLRSVPFRDPERLVNVWQTAEGAKDAPGLVGRTWNRLPFSLEDYRIWRAETTAFEEVAVHNAVETTLTGQGSAERVSLGETGSLAIRRAERLSNTHWKLVWLSRQQGWKGEAVVVEQALKKYVALIPGLALDVKVRVQGEPAPNSLLELVSKEVDLPDLLAYFSTKIKSA